MSTQLFMHTSSHRAKDFSLDAAKLATSPSIVFTSNRFERLPHRCSRALNLQCFEIMKNEKEERNATAITRRQMYSITMHS